MTQPSNDETPRGEPRMGIACPGCGAHPIAGMQWFCGPDGCGGSFDTFASHGRCPHCQAQFSWTDCASCGRRFAHAAFYR